MPLLSVNNLAVEFATPHGALRAVDGISFDIEAGRTTCLVGESGCGKSVTSAAILRLLPTPPARVVSGSIILDNRDLLTIPEHDMRAVLDGSIAMIFQDPMTSLNPVYPCGFQIAEAIALHTRCSQKEAADRAVAMLQKVGIPDPKRRATEYPHQLSGGMRQRVMIAMALSCEPRLLVADEPTTALDVTVQAQILDLLRRLSEENNMAVLFITHDLGIVAEIAHEVIVLYAGRIAERGTASDIFTHAKHPYTAGLMRSIPALHARGEKLFVIPGTLPDPVNLPQGCRFKDRCIRATNACAQQPAETSFSATHAAACFNPES